MNSVSSIFVRTDQTVSVAERNRTLSPQQSLFTLVLAAGALALVCAMIEPIPQPQWYHQFTDRRSFLGIPNFGDVASNLPFAVIGSWGLVFLLRSRVRPDAKVFLDAREQWPYLFVFAGLLLTAFGSAYYHLAPGNSRLVCDRLPMTITFLSLVAAVIAERIHIRLGIWLLPVLLLVGQVSVLQWYWSETKGRGDLRFYAAVQAFSALVILLAILFPRRYTRTADFGLVAGFYVLAKALELLDKPVFAVLHVVSGHTLKHLVAAAAGYCILRMLQKRKPITSTSNAVRRI
ncbi:MAG TPA: hypothetical protein VGR47_13875 [Terracidiphilus sp.]|nr:hypothetical protein [Terracidiphilus sp.]